MDYRSTFPDIPLFLVPVDDISQIDWNQPPASYEYDVPPSWIQGPQVGEPAFLNPYPGIPNSNYRTARSAYQPETVEGPPFTQGVNAVNHVVPSGQRRLSMGRGFEPGANLEVHEGLRRSISSGSVSSRSSHTSRTSATHSIQPQSQFRPGLSRPNALQLERINRVVDPRYSEVAGRIVNIMGDTQVHYHDKRPTASSAASQLQTLNAYIQSLSPDLQTWVCGYRPTITSPSHQEQSKHKRKPSGGRLYYCLWCDSTFTMKHNLANHVRSHLDFHISFCQHCDFSSVCSSLPTRHQCSR